MAWKEKKTDIKDPVVEQHSVAGQAQDWWMVTLENDSGSGGSSGHGFSTKEDANNAIALHRALMRHGWSGSINFKIMHRVEPTK